MTDEKTKVKDLAVELHVDSRDLIQTMRTMGINVRNASSVVSAEDLRKIRDRYKTGNRDAAREKPAVIVRHRQRPARNEGARADSPATASPSVTSENTPETATVIAPESDAPATIAAPAERMTRETPSEPIQQEKNENRNRQKERPRKRLREATPAARVISRPQDIAAAEAAAKAAEEARLQEENRRREEARLEEEARKKAEIAAKNREKESEKEEKQEKTERDRRIQPAASASPAGSSAPSLLPPLAETSRPTGSNDENGDGERRERRKRRQPEQPQFQVRIISRPDSVASTPQRETEPSRESRGDRGDRPEGRRSASGNRPRGDRSGGDRSGGYQNQSKAGGYQNQSHTGGSYQGNRFGSGNVQNGYGDPMQTNLEGRSKKKQNKGSRRGPDFQDTNLLDRRHEDDDEMPRTRSVRRRPKPRPAAAPQPVTQPIKAAKRKIRIEEAITVADMARQMGLKASEIIKVLFNLGVMATINKALDIDTAGIVASEFGYEVEKTGFAEEEYLEELRIPDKPEQLKLRPPVVTIMGHVDHGKTSLLDAIRKTHVTSGEAGGITQHIGAYHVKTKRGEIVFLDTPGHEAFTAMRARGAQVTDLVVLVVAADDGVMEQTREAINHSRAAGVPIMVAVNKIDKPTANPDRVLHELASLGLVAEDWGGDTVVCRVSAKTHEGLDDMLEMLALQADILELKANPDKPARGHIVEARLDKGRGPVATVLIQEGTLHQGDSFVCGVFSGRVRSLFNDQGRKVKEAGPSIPVEVQGFSGVPEAGEEFICLEDEKLARRIAESRAIKQREKELAKQSRVTLETFLAQKADDQEVMTLNLVVKSDVQGSQEAILEALRKLSNDKVHLDIIHGGTGAITESDILLASASNAIIIGFNVRPTAKVKEVAEHERVDIRFYDIIYKLVDEIKSAMAGLLAPVTRENYLGQAEVREVYTISRVGSIAGSLVTDGKITRSANVRLLRNGVVVHNGKIASLRRFKDDVREVLKGYECGISLENFNDIKIGDVLEAFEMVEEAAQL